MVIIYMHNLVPSKPAGTEMKENLLLLLENVWQLNEWLNTLEQDVVVKGWPHKFTV